jgi:copper(I)-binding protein
MRKRSSIFVGIAVIAFASGTVAHETRYKAIIVIHPWVLETEQAQADLHVRIKNTGKAAEKLLRASTPLAASVALVDATGRHVNDLAIPALGEVNLQSGGGHIVLSGLKKPLRPYENFALTLVFENAGSMRVEVSVEEKTSSAGRARYARHDQGKIDPAKSAGTVFVITPYAIASRE